MQDKESQLKQILRASPTIMTVMETCRDLKLPDWRIVSGAIYGTVFNHLTGRNSDYGIKDFDIAYFDPDTSYEAEDVWIKRVDKALPPALAPRAEVRNQARVHLWFKDRFGGDYAPLSNTDESLLRYLCFAHMIAARLEENDDITIAAPAGLEDMFNMVLRHNPERGAYDKFLEKSNSILERWPEVRIIE